MEVQLWGSTAPEVTATGTSSAGASTATALGERKIKMNGVLDQGDDSEFTLDDTKDTVKAHERYVNLMGGPPTPEQEPTAEQLSAMRRRVETLQLSPYADFAVWVQFAKKKLKALKLKTWTMQQDGSFVAKDLPGPPDHTQAMTARGRRKEMGLQSFRAVHIPGAANKVADYLAAHTNVKVIFQRSSRTRRGQSSVFPTSARKDSPGFHSPKWVSLTFGTSALDREPEEGNGKSRRTEDVEQKNWNSAVGEAHTRDLWDDDFGDLEGEGFEGEQDGGGEATAGLPFALRSPPGHPPQQTSEQASSSSMTAARRTLAACRVRAKDAGDIILRGLGRGED